MGPLAGAPVTLEGAEVARLMWELRGTRGRTLLPAGLWPTTPTMLTVQTLRWAGNDDLGAFTALTVSLSCRSGARARALVIGGAVDADDATAARLTDGWAFPGARMPVRFERRYDATHVAVDGLVDAEARDLAPLGVHDTQFVVQLQPAVVDGADRVVQVDVDVEPTRSERGRPQARSFTMDGADGRPLELGLPVAAVVALGTLTLPRVRFVLDPALEPHVGTSAVG